MHDLEFFLQNQSLGCSLLVSHRKQFQHLSDPQSWKEQPLPETLLLIKEGSFLQTVAQVLESQKGPLAPVLVITKDLEASSLQILEPYLRSHEVSLVTTSQFQNLLLAVCEKFDDKARRWPLGIHPTAIIDSTAKVSPYAHIGPGSVIGARATVEAHALLEASVIVESDARVGRNTRLHSQVVIGARCQVGDRCEIHSGTVVGSDGFGFIPQKQGPPIKIPQVGSVVIEDDVEIGSNCSIDRATLGVTRIGSGTKMDNLIHIGHNCKIGAESLITAGFMIAGSSSVGKRFVTGGSTVIADHCHITDHVTLGGKSGVTKDITESGAYMGYPLEPMRDGLRTLSILRNLPSLKKDLTQLQKDVETLKAGEKTSCQP